jgi:YD repeat-containing protein
MKRMVVRALPVLLPFLAATAAADTIRVPADQPAIQLAIEAARDGDVIVVAPGSYFENVDFLGRAVTVRSEGDPRTTIIDGSSQGSVVTCASGEGPRSILSGFTIRNGRSGEGGGIRIEDSSPTIKNSIIKKNRACSGSGISIAFGSPLIRGNRIRSNGQADCSGSVGGGGIAIRGAGAARILDNIIADNLMGSADGGGISLFAAGAPMIKRNIIRGNLTNRSGGGISMVNPSDALIVQNLVTGNVAGDGGGIYWLVPSGNRGPFLINNTIADNFGVRGSGVFADGFDGASRLMNNLIVASSGEDALFCGDFNDTEAPIIRFNDVFSSDGVAYAGTCADHTGTEGNISADPSFVAAPTRNYHIGESSPAVDAGTNAAPKLPALDFDGAKRIQDGDGDGTALVDMGIDEFAPGGKRRNQSLAGLAISSAADAVDDVPFPVEDLSWAFGGPLREIGFDNRVTVYTCDADGRLVARTDADGVKRSPPSMGSRARCQQVRDPPPTLEIQD